VLAGTLTILLIFLIATRWWGGWAGVVAAGLLAIERYHSTISARAIDLPYDLFFVTLAIYAFSRFLHETRAPEAGRASGRWLYATGAAIGVGFLCKELTAIMIPVIGASLLVTGRGAWLRRREPWLALGLFVLIISPDLYSNATATPEERRAMFDRHQEAVAKFGGRLTDPAYVENGLYMSYGDHLSRFRSIGFNREPFYFYFGDFFDWLGIAHVNEFAEFPYVHLIHSLLLWIAVVFTVVTRPRDACALFLLTTFVLVLVPFALVRLGPAHATLPTGPDVLWYWIDRSMLAAVLLAGRAGALLPGLLRRR
jgi:4-amino-4-deoxy-L-arabinose transferase-like glycosyltransferase